MSESNEDNGSINAKLENIENRLIKIHETMKISMACIIIFLFIIMLLLWYSPTF